MAESHLKIRWGDLGPPGSPGMMDYYGQFVEVRQKDIDAAKGDPNAVFTAAHFQPLSGTGDYYVLENVRGSKDS
jgi:hypothetical protein